MRELGREFAMLANFIPASSILAPPRLTAARDCERLNQRE
jgi:hypothetical protein